MIKNDWNMKHNFLWCLQPLAQQDFHKTLSTREHVQRNLTLPSLRVPEKIWPFVTNSSLLRHHCVPRSKTYTCCGSTAAAMVPGLHLLRKSCSSLRAPLGAVHFMALPRSKTGMLQNLNFDKHCGKKHWHFTGDNPDNPDLQNFPKDNNRLLLWSSSQSRFALWEMRKRKEVPRILPLTLRLFKKNSSCLWNGNHVEVQLVQHLCTWNLTAWLQILDGPVHIWNICLYGWEISPELLEDFVECSEVRLRIGGQPLWLCPDQAAFRGSWMAAQESRVQPEVASGPQVSSKARGFEDQTTSLAQHASNLGVSQKKIGGFQNLGVNFLYFWMIWGHLHFGNPPNGQAVMIRCPPARAKKVSVEQATNMHRWRTCEMQFDFVTHIFCWFISGGFSWASGV